MCTRSAVHQVGSSNAAAPADPTDLARRRRVLGEGHPLTLISASNLAADLRALGQHEAAHQLDEDTETRRRASGELIGPDDASGWWSG